MPNGLFNQSIETQPAQQQVVSPVTANPTAQALQSLAPLVQTGAEIGIGFQQKAKLEGEFDVINEELSGLDRELNGIDQAIKSGANKGALQMRARAALKSAIATSPTLKGHAESLYSNYFGGGGGAGGTGGGTSGSFSLSPREEAARALDSEISELVLLGYPEDKAKQAAQVKRQAAIAKDAADTLANEANVNLYQVKPVADSLIMGENVKFQTGLSALLKEGPLTEEGRIAIGRDIEMGLANIKRSILKSVTNADGQLTISPSALDGMYQDAEDQAEGWKTLVKDNSAVDFYKNKVDIVNSQTQLAAYKHAPQMSIIREVLGDQATSEYIKALGTGNQKLLTFITKNNPELGSLLGGQFNLIEETSLKATANIFNTETKLTPMENTVIANQMAISPPYAMQILEKAGADKFRGITFAHPQSLAATYSPKTASMRAKPEITGGITEMQRGALDNFNDLFRSEFGRFPSGLEITVSRQDPRSRRSSNTPYANFAVQPQRISVNAVSGEQMTQEMVNIVGDLYRSIEANPDTIPEPLRNKGLSVSQIATAWINSGMDTEALKYYEPFLEATTEAQKSFSYRTPEPAAPSADITSKRGAGSVDATP